MKSIFIVLAVTSFYGMAHTQDESLGTVLVCAEVNGKHILSVLRSAKIEGRGVILYGTSDQSRIPMVVKEESHDAEIAYTNGGARAIVTTAQLPQLIFAGHGSTELKWDEKNWMCHSSL